MAGFLIFCAVLQAALRLGLAAPSIEACPPDSVLFEDTCICNPELCKKPPCLSHLEMISKGNSEPGECCPIYSCVGCKNETLLDGKCPCAPGAVLNDVGVCECVDKEKHLVNGECICNPLQCELPKICDKKSVLIVEDDEKDGCCKKTRCQTCPYDTESTNYSPDQREEREDHCVCLPCRKECEYNKVVRIIQNGTGLPGHCCDLYECIPREEENKNDKDNNCVVGDIIYENGEEYTDNEQQCKCQEGISLCQKRIEELPHQNCYDEGTTYRPNETWSKDHGCTICTCDITGPSCVSHYCDVMEIKEFDSKPCLKGEKSYNHLQTWIEDDNCTSCSCTNGKINCTSTSCIDKELSNPGECQPLSKCNKRCPDGFRINKNGCEICRCNLPKVNPELLIKYNITYSKLLNILEDYKKSSDLASIIEETTPMPTVMVIEPNGDDEITASPETMITPSYRSEEDKSCYIIIAALAALIVGAVAGSIAYCFYKNKRKYSLTPSRSSYQTVINPTADNNNTIKKESIRFEETEPMTRQ